MDWSDLRIFLTAVRAGSYTAAGPQLGLNRTTVGRRIAALEAGLGTTLFRDTPFGFEPTRTGRLLLASAERIEAEIAALANALHAGQAGSAPLRLAGSAGIAVEFLAEIAAFAQSHGEARVELTGALDPIDAVTQRRADIAIALVRAVPRRLVGIQIGMLSQAPYARRGSPPGSGARRPLGWGAEIELTLPRHWTAANDAADAGTSRFNNWAGLRRAVGEGVGSAWLWCFAGDADPALERIGPPDPRYDTGLWLLHRADTPQSTHAAALTRFLADAIAARIPGGTASV